MAIIKNPDGDGWIDTQCFIAPPTLSPQFNFVPQYPLTKNGEYDPRDFRAFHREWVAQLRPDSFEALEQAMVDDRADRDANKAAGRGWVSSQKWEPAAVIIPEVCDGSLLDPSLN